MIKDVIRLKWEAQLSHDKIATALAVAGRYILTPGIFAELERLSGGVGGEIQLTEGIAQLLRREKLFVYRYHGVRYDCGSKLGFLQATVDMGQHHAEVGAEFRQWLRAREEAAEQA